MLDLLLIKIIIFGLIKKVDRSNIENVWDFTFSILVPQLVFLQGYVLLVKFIFIAIGTFRVIAEFVALLIASTYVFFSLEIELDIDAFW